MAIEENRMKQNRESYSRDSSVTTIPEKEKKSAVSGGTLSSQIATENKNIINTFVEYCNNKNIESAYNLITDECKEKMFPTMQDFYDTYYSKIFGEARICELQVWITEGNWYTYEVKLMEDILSTGRTGQTTMYTDYYTIVKTEQGEQKLNINRYIGRKNIEKETVGGTATVKVLSKDVYLDYELYNMEIKNNTSKTILIDSQRKTDTVFLIDNNSLSYQANIHEIDASTLRLDGYIQRKISIKFNKVYNPSRKIRTINFTDIIPDYEEYKENSGEYEKSQSMMIHI